MTLSFLYFVTLVHYDSCCSFICLFEIDFSVVNKLCKGFVFVVWQIVFRFWWFDLCKLDFDTFQVAFKGNWLLNRWYPVTYVFLAFEWNEWRLRKDSKILPVSGSFSSNLKFFRMMDFTACLWGWNVRVNGILLLFSFRDICSADCWSICWARWWPAWTTEAG